MSNGRVLSGLRERARGPWGAERGHVCLAERAYGVERRLVRDVRYWARVWCGVCHGLRGTERVWGLSGGCKMMTPDGRISVDNTLNARLNVVRKRTYAHALPEANGS
eukprot:2196557-Rhodomonas_salina.1